MDSVWVFFTALVACLGCSLIHWIVRQRRKCFDAFEGTGIPTVPLRSLINGNSDEFWKPSCIQSLDRWIREYGDVFGFFVGDTPFVVTKDLDMINDIFIKECNKFQGRGRMLNIYELDPLFAKYVVFSKGETWKTARTCIAQFFTPSKIKAVMPSLLNAQQEFIEILGEHADRGAETEINTLCERFTFDAIAKAAFGIDTDVQRNPGNPIFKTALSVFPNLNTGLFYELGQNLYHWSWILKAPMKLMLYVYKNPLANLARKAAEVIQFRRKNPQVILPDLAQILLDGVLGRGESNSENGKSRDSSAEIPQEIMNQLASNCQSVFLGGYDTTRLVMTFWFFLMGKYPEIQEKMRQEVAEVFKKEGGKLSCQTLTKLVYTNQVISETMRIYPPLLTFTSRCANEDYRYGTYLIKKGTSVMVPTYQLHHDPQYWTEAETFDPNRFSPEKVDLIHPAAYQPFGIGPRTCIGQRLALVQLASVTAQVLHQFRITLGPSQKTDLDLGSCSFFATTKEKVRIQLDRLTSNT